MGNYLNTEQLAERIHISPMTAAIWRCRGRGPRWIKAGNRVLYDEADVQSWLEANRRQSTREAPARSTSATATAA